MIRSSVLLIVCTTALLSAAEPAAPAAPDAAQLDKLIAQSQAWLRAQQQPDGAFFHDHSFALGTTEIAVLGMLEAGVPADDPAVAKAIAYIKSYRQPDGGIYSPEAGLGNYCTSFALMVFAKAGETDKGLIEGAQKYLLGLQNTEGGINDGGIGYGSRGKGNEDLSNTSMAIEALAESGLPASHPGMQRALAFVQRCQNLTSHNKSEWAVNDGGAAYSPDSSKAGSFYEDGHEGEKPKIKTEVGNATKLVSYGSMTYALIKSYLHLDLKPGDPRLDAALKWVLSNYQFDENPGMAEGKGLMGLYYYYNAMAKTFDALDKTTITLPDGQVVDWRTDLFNSIKERAQFVKDAEGNDAQAYWINSEQRWGEGLPHLVTSYNLVALGRIKQSLAK